MRPGYVIGIEDNIGDGFCYKILPYADITKIKGRVKHISQSVVRSRNIAKDEYPPMVEEKANI